MVITCMAHRHNFRCIDKPLAMTIPAPRGAWQTVCPAGLATVLLTALAPPSDPSQAGVADLAARAGLSRTWGDCFGYFTLATGAADVMVDTGLPKASPAVSPQ
eukprot:EG_transcript_23011